METACARFFSSPELLTTVGTHLPKDSLARALTVNEVVYEAFSPLLYHTLNSRQTDRILSARRAAFPGLFSNARHVRSISMSGEFCVRMVHGFLTHINATDPSLDMPEWVGLLGPSGDDVEASVPLLPLPYLTRLKFDTKSESYYKPSRALTENYNSGVLLGQIVVVMRFSSHLAQLDLQDIRLHGERDLDFLSSVINRSSSLATIELKLETADKNLRDKVVPKIFFSCPTNVKTLDVSLSLSEGAIGSATSTFIGSTVGTLARRQEPLQHLVKLNISTQKGFDSDVICSIFDHCTALTTLEIPLLRQKKDAARIGRHIAERCSVLKNLAWSSLDPCETSDLLTTAIINAMPQDQLASISYCGHDPYGSELILALFRHVGSLTTIKFNDCRVFHEEDIMAILRQCSVLKVFEVTATTTRDVMIGAKELTSFDWASNAIQELQLAVAFASFSEMKAMRRCPTDETRSVISEKQKNGPTALGKLYRKIRSLPDLKHVELKIYLYDDGPNPQWPAYDGPGHLTGGEVKTGEPFSFVRQDWSWYMKDVVW